MSSVPKYRRKESRFEVLHHSIVLRNEIMDLVMRNFSYKEPKKNADPFALETSIANNNMAEFIKTERICITNILRDISKYISMANSIYPTIKEELIERRGLQNKAIESCSNLTVELQFCMTYLKNIKVDSFLRYIDIVQKQIKLLKAWRKSDNKIKDKLLGLKSEE